MNIHRKMVHILWVLFFDEYQLDHGEEPYTYTNLTYLSILSVNMPSINVSSLIKSTRWLFSQEKSKNKNLRWMCLRRHFLFLLKILGYFIFSESSNLTLYKSNPGFRGAQPTNFLISLMAAVSNVNQLNGWFFLVWKLYNISSYVETLRRKKLLCFRFCAFPWCDASNRMIPIDRKDLLK